MTDVAHTTFEPERVLGVAEEACPLTSCFTGSCTGTPVRPRSTAAATPG